MAEVEWLDRAYVKVSSWNEQLWATESFSYRDVKEKYLDQALVNAPYIFKHDQTTTVGRWEASSNRLILKRFNARSEAHKLKRALRRSRARACWLMSYEFQRLGLNVPEPVLMYEPRTGPFRGNSYFANLYLPGEVLLTSLPKMPKSQQIKVASAVGEAFEIMRENKLTHGDLKASNLIWMNDKLYFIDLDAATYHGTSLSWRITQNSQKTRFMKNWDGLPAVKHLFRNI